MLSLTFHLLLFSATTAIAPSVSVENGPSQEKNPPSFEAVLGSTAHLPCDVPLRPPSSGIKCIFWYKDDEVMSVYTVDARLGGDANRSTVLHVPSDRLRSRARFEPSPWPPLLRLVGVREADAGLYYCRVDYRWDRTYMHTVMLRVIVPPQRLSILSEQDEEIVGMAGPYLEGQRVRMACEAIGGKPSPSLSWWRGPAPLEGGPPTSAHGVVRSEYSFVPRRSDQLTGLTCRAVNNNVTAPTTVSVQVDLYLKPLDISLSPQLPSFTAGRQVELRCASGGSRPAARMSWFLEGEPLPGSRDLLSPDGNRTTSVLTFHPSRGDHGKRLRCRAENFLLSDSALEDSFLLNITYVPIVTLHLRGSSSRPGGGQQGFLEGSDVRFECEVKSNPAATETGWRLDGRPLPSDDPELVVGWRSLVVRRLRRRHRGGYQCYAENAEGTGLSRVLHLKTMYAPVCRPGLRKTYPVAAGETEAVECRVEADPPAVEFRWSFSNAAHRHYNVSSSSAGLRSVANYAPGDPRDYGSLYCWGRNAVGEQQMPCIFVVIPRGPPDSLLDCSAANVTATSVTVACQRGPGRDPDLRYNLEVFAYHSHEMALQVSSGEPHFVVEGLSPGTELLFVIYAQNSNGKSSPQMVKVATLNSAPTEDRVYGRRGSSERPDGPDSWIGVALLVIAALCFFLLFAGAAACNRFGAGPGCQKCKELPKQLQMKTGFSKRIKANKNYIDRLPEGYIEKRTPPCV